MVWTTTGHAILLSAVAKYCDSFARCQGASCLARRNQKQAAGGSKAYVSYRKQVTGRGTCVRNQGRLWAIRQKDTGGMRARKLDLNAMTPRYGTQETFRETSPLPIDPFQGCDMSDVETYPSLTHKATAGKLGPRALYASFLTGKRGVSFCNVTQSLREHRNKQSSIMSSPPWQDRRGMFQTGKVLHEPAARRRSSASESKAAKPGGLATLAALAGTDTTPESSTKFIYRRGKEVHEGSAARKKSMSEDKPAAAPVAAEPGTAAVRKVSPVNDAAIIL